MTEETPIPLPLPADVLARKLSVFAELVAIVRDVQAKGLIEYGEPLTVDSEVVVKTIRPGKDGAPATVEERREPLTTANSLDNAIREGIDAACYAIAAQQAHGGADMETDKEIALGTWQIITGLQTLHKAAARLP